MPDLDFSPACPCPQTSLPEDWAVWPGSELPATNGCLRGTEPGPEAPAAQAGGLAPSLPTWTIWVKETVPLAVVNEKGGGRTAGSPCTTSPVRTKGRCPATSQEYAIRAAPETTRALRAADGGGPEDTWLLWRRSRRHPATPPHAPPWGRVRVENPQCRALPSAPLHIRTTPCAKRPRPEPHRDRGGRVSRVAPPSTRAPGTHPGGGAQLWDWPPQGPHRSWPSRPARG